MPNIQFPQSSAPGQRPQESGGRLINAYVEKAPVGAPSDTIIGRSPGLRFLVRATGFEHTRGFLDAGGQLLWVLNGQVFRVDSDFSLTNLGALAGTLPVTMARNNALVPNNVVVTEVGCFNLFSAAPPTPFADADLPPNPTSVALYEGFFIWTFANGQIWASDLNSVNVNALSFTTVQGLSVRRGVSYAGRFFAFGDKWTEVYRNAGTLPFPLAREATVPRGIVGPHAVAGWEYGWANELLWAGDDFVVYKMSGFTPQPVSTNDVSRDLQRAVLAGLRDTIEAYVYMYNNNAFWVLHCHNLWTWELNLTTGAWNERKSYNRDNWKANRSIRMFDRWLIGSIDELLYELSGDHFQEDLDPLIWFVESGVVTGFPVRTVIPRASFFMTAAIGSIELEANPRVAISWSLDGGHSWGQPVLRRLGAPGESRFYPSILGTGISRGQGIRFRLVVSDPVHVGLSGGVISDPQQRGIQG